VAEVLADKLGRVLSGEEFLSEVLTGDEKRLLGKPSNEEARKFVNSYLNESERRLVDTGDRDLVALAIINQMLLFDPIRFSQFDKFFPMRSYMLEYIQGQKKWLLKQYELLGWPSDDMVVIRNSQKFYNPERYKILFIINNPRKVIETGFEYIGSAA